MIARPGTFLGFLAHDARLSARALFALLGERSIRAKWLILACVVAGLHGVAWFAAEWSASFEAGPDAERIVALAARGATLFVLPWAIASTMTATTRMLYQRGDLDLLFTAPISPAKALAARTFGQAIEAIASVGILLFPFAHASALQGRPHWLSLYPALFADGLFGAGLGLVLSLALVFAAGPRRARLVSQLGATFIGASAVISAQALAMLPTAWRDALYERASAPFPGGETLRGVLALPERALLADPVALILWLSIGAAAFALAIAVSARPFAVAAMRTAGAPVAAARLAKSLRFRSGLGAALRWKEYRLLSRDPWLLSQMLLQALYTLPVGIILWRQGGVTGHVGVAFGPTLAIIAGQFSGALAWIALSAEDAPDFLATAPATRGQIERAKLATIGWPVLFILAPAVALLAIFDPWAGACTAICGLGAALSGGLLMLWRQTPARRGLVLRRHSASKLIGLGEHWLSLQWGVATGLAVFGSLFCFAPVGVVVLTLWALRPRSPRLPRLVSARA